MTQITHAKYNKDGSITAGPIEGQTWGGITPASRFWLEVQEWIDAGNTPEAYVEPVVPFPTLSPRQLRLALLSTGTTEADVDAMIAATPDPEDRAWSEIEWKHATSFDRNHLLIESFGPAMGYAPEQIDALWAWASAL